jgi:hypothetical protein
MQIHKRKIKFISEIKLSTKRIHNWKRGRIEVYGGPSSETLVFIKLSNYGRCCISVPQQRFHIQFQTEEG